VLSEIGRVRVHLRCRQGLEQIVRQEVEDTVRTQSSFAWGMWGVVWVELYPVAAFSLADIYSLRCFASAGLVIGHSQVVRRG